MLEHNQEPIGDMGQAQADSGLRRLAESYRQLRNRTQTNPVAQHQLLLSGTELALDAFEQAMNDELGQTFGVESFEQAHGEPGEGRLVLQKTASDEPGIAVVNLLQNYRARNPLDWNGVPLLFRTYTYRPVAAPTTEVNRLIATENESATRGLQPADAHMLHEATELTPTLLAGRINDWLCELEERGDAREKQYHSIEACANPLLNHAEGWPVWQADSDNGSGSGGPLLSEPPLGAEAEQGGLAQLNARLLRRLGTAEAAATGGQGVTVVILDTAPVDTNGYVDFRTIDPRLVDFCCDVQTVPVTTFKPAEPKTDPGCRCMRRDTDAFFGSNGRSSDEIDEARRFGKEYHGLFVASLVKLLAPHASILLLRVLDHDAIGDAADIMRAINLAMALRADKTMLGGQRVVEERVVFNLSLGLNRTLSEEVEACALLRVIEAAAYEGALFVAAAGNDSWPNHPRNPEEPAAYGYFADGEHSCGMMICVAATGEATPTKLAYFSNQGMLGAPAQHIYMETGNPTRQPYLKPGQPLQAPAYVNWSGTSFATPLVAATAARLLSEGIEPANIKDELWQRSAKPTQWDGIPELRIEQ